MTLNKSTREGSQERLVGSGVGSGFQLRAAVEFLVREAAFQ